MLLVVDPVPLVLGSIGVSVFSETVSLVFAPVAVVDVPVSMDQAASAVGFVVFPISFINTAVRPYLVSSAVALVGVDVPLPFVLATVLKDDHRPLLLDDTWLVVLITLPAILKFWK